MGIYNTTYVGCYIIVSAKTEQYEERKYVNPISGKKKKTRFNPETGEENKLVVETKTRNVLPSLYELEVDGFSEDEFFSPAYCLDGITETLYVPNNDKFRLGEFDHHETGHVPFELDSNVFGKIEEFKEYYKVYFEAMKNKGIDFTTHVGAVNYAH